MRILLVLGGIVVVAALAVGVFLWHKHSSQKPSDTPQQDPSQKPSDTPQQDPSQKPTDTNSCRFVASPHKKVGLLLGATTEEDFCGTRVATVNEVRFNYNSTFTTDGPIGIANNSGYCSLIRLDRSYGYQQRIKNNGGESIDVGALNAMFKTGYGKCNGNNIPDFVVNVAPTVGNYAAATAVWVVVNAGWKPPHPGVQLEAETPLTNLYAWRFS